MALPPVKAAAPPVNEAMAAVPVAEDVEVMEPATGWVPFATLMKNEETGAFMVVDGLLPEGDEVSDDTGPIFEDGPALLQGLMEKVEGGNREAADEAFGKGFRGEPDDAPAKPPVPPMPMA